MRMGSQGVVLAARGGHLEELKWLLEKHIDPSTLLMDQDE